MTTIIFVTPDQMMQRKGKATFYKWLWRVDYATQLNRHKDYGHEHDGGWVHVKNPARVASQLRAIRAR